VETPFKYNSDQSQVMTTQKLSVSLAIVLQSSGESSKEVPSSCRGQVDSPSGKVTFHSHLPDGQGIRQVICQLNYQKSKLLATCPKGTGSRNSSFFFLSTEWCQFINTSLPS